MKIAKSIVFGFCLIFLVFAADISAQESEEQAKIRRRVEELFKTIREEKWNELTRFVIVSTDMKSPQTRLRMNISESDGQEETNKKVGEYFKEIYGYRKPGNIISITIFPKDSTLAGIGYKHGDKDGFLMRLYKNEWYYTLDRELEKANSK